MSRGLTIAQFVQQVYYAIYKVRLDTTFDPVALPQAYHADTDKFKEVVFEANLVQQELQQAMDWNWLRSRWMMGISGEGCDAPIAEYKLPDDIYKVCTGFNDAVRLHDRRNPNSFIEVPYTSPRSGTTNIVAMFNEHGQLDVSDNRLMAFVVGEILTFNRPFQGYELNRVIETDVVRLLPELHICGVDCTQPCPQAYEDKVFTEITDPLYMVIRTAGKRAEGDPSVSDRAMALSEESMKLLSAMRENDSAKTIPDTYQSIELGYTRVL